jgi:hypothetical protein
VFAPTSTRACSLYCARRIRLHGRLPNPMRYLVHPPLAQFQECPREKALPPILRTRRASGNAGQCAQSCEHRKRTGY